MDLEPGGILKALAAVAAIIALATQLGLAGPSDRHPDGAREHGTGVATAAKP